MSTVVLESTRGTFSAPPVPMGDLFPFPERPELCGAVCDGAGLLRLSYADGSTTTVAALALRDACCCTSCRHPESLERTLDQLQLDPAIRAERLEILADGDLEAGWSDGHVSRYQPGWLRAGGRSEWVTPLPPVRLWDRSLEIPAFAHAEVLEDDATRRAWLEALVERGIAYVTGVPREPGAVVRLIEQVGPVRDTNFGLVFDVRAVVGAISNAYTAQDLPLHVDLPSREYMPGYQFLHCIANDAAGGASVYGDAFAMAEDLRVEDPDAFRILSEVPVRFRYHDERTDYVATRPILGCDPDGRLVEVRFNTSLMTAFQAPAERMAEIWRAYRAFLARTRDPAYQVETRMRPGEVACFDNRRVLHGRRAFAPSTGLRHLQGAYLEREDLLSTLRILQRAGSLSPQAGRTGRRKDPPG